MPVVDEDKSSGGAPPPIETLPRIEPAKLNTPVEDTRYVPRQNLLAFIEGSPWSVDYYSQVLGTSSEISAQQMNMSGPLQQYRLVKKMELRVTDPLSPSQDGGDKSMSLHGSALVYPCLVPNEGDMFIADIGDGRKAVFEIESSERKSVRKESVYAITYAITDYATDERVSDLNRKTIETLHFIHDFLIYGQNPMVTTDTYAAVTNMPKFYKRSITDYINMFMSRDYKAIIVPGQSQDVYDFFISDFISKITTVRDAAECNQLNVLNCNHERRLITNTILTAIVWQDVDMLSNLTTRASSFRVMTWGRVPSLDSVYYSGMDKIILPIENSRGVIDDGRVGEAGQLESTGDFYSGSVMFPAPDGAPSEVMFIKPVLVDDYYILSEAFYKNDRQAMSLLEMLVMDHIEQRQPVFDHIALLISDSVKWGKMELFYYMPLLYSILKNTIRVV